MNHKKYSTKARHNKKDNVVQLTKNSKYPDILCTCFDKKMNWLFQYNLNQKPYYQFQMIANAHNYVFVCCVRWQVASYLQMALSHAKMQFSTFSCFDSPLCSSITSSLFRLQLKTCLFHKFFFPQFHFFYQDCLHRLLPGPFLLSYSVFVCFLVFPYFLFQCRALD